MSVDNYFLLVESLDPEVVAFAPMLASNYPRVIAVGEGNGDLLRVTLLLPDDCRVKRNNQLTKQVISRIQSDNQISADRIFAFPAPKKIKVFKETQGPLASSLASVQVDFNTVDFPDNPDTFQNDGVSGRDRKPNQDPSLLSDILIGIPLNDEKKLGGMGGDTRPNENGILSFYPSQSHSALVIGMYVVLSTFCFAIVVFVVSCFVYASKHKMINVEHKERTPGVRTMPSATNRGTAAAGSSTGTGHFPILRESRRKQHRESTTNAHNWVWLGRSTMDHSSIIQENNEHFLNPRG